MNDWKCLVCCKQHHPQRTHNFWRIIKSILLNRAFKVKVLCNRSLYSSQLSRQQSRDWRFHCEPDKARTVRQAVWGHLKLIDLFSTVNDKCVSQVRLGLEEINMLKKVKSKRLKVSYIKQHLKSCVIMTNQCSFLSHCIDGLFLWCACEIRISFRY